MSLLHRSLLAQIMAGMEPVVDAALTALVPGGVAMVPLVNAGLDAAENVSDSVSLVHETPVAVAGTTINSPLPAAAPAPAPAPVIVAPAPAPVVAPAPVTAVTAVTAVPVPAGEKLQASDVVNALMQTLIALQAKL